MIPALALTKLRRQLSFFFRGLLMGVADLIPGISGATIALVTGIYEKLIKNLHTLFHKNTKRFHLRAYWQNITHLEFGFLLPLGLGMASMIVLGSHIIPELIETYPVPVFGLFLGIILASSVWLFKQVPERAGVHWVAFAFSLVLGIGFALLGEGLETTTPNYSLLFLIGAIALSAMILPGISGSYVLLIFGHYTLVLNAIRHFDVLTLLVFGLGGLFGLFTMSKALHHILEQHKGIALFSLTGLMLGAAYRPYDLVAEATTSTSDIALAIIAVIVGVLLFQLLSLAERVAKHE